MTQQKSITLALASLVITLFCALALIVNSGLYHTIGVILGATAFVEFAVVLWMVGDYRRSN